MTDSETSNYGPLCGGVWWYTHEQDVSLEEEILRDREEEAHNEWLMSGGDE